MSDMVITIITKNSPIKLKRILNSISANNFLKNDDILVIDDSSDDKSISDNVKSITNMKNLNIVYINGQSRNSIKIDILHKISKPRKVFLENITLGSKEWNTYNVRNIGSIIAKLIFKNKKYIIGLDDDMIVEENFSLDIKYLNKKTLLGIKLKGCPDLSRLEWIKAYNRCMVARFGVTIKKENTDYINTLVEKFSIETLERKLNTYTDLKISHLRDNETKDNVLPKRESLHGGGYISNIDNLEDFPFPSFYNEDWYWFDQIKHTKKIVFKFVNQSVIHGASAKKILLKDKIFFEEEGEILKWYYANGNCKKAFSYFINKKIHYLKHEITITKQLEKIDSTNKGLYNKIIFILQETIKLYISFLKSEHLFERISYSNEYGDNWVCLIKELKKIHISEDVLINTDFRVKKVIFSPHIDDAVLSMGGYILNTDRESVIVENIFTLSTYTKYGIGDVNQVSGMRISEEKKVSDLLKIKTEELHFEDAVIRIGSNEHDYINPLYDPSNDQNTLNIYNKIKKKLSIYQKAILFFPLSIGDHVDHKTLFEIGKKLHHEGLLVAFYEDIGYDECLDKKYINEKLQQIDIPLKSFIFPTRNIKAKSNICKLYESQVDNGILKSVRKVYNKNKGEKIWIPIASYKNLLNSL